MAIDRTAYNALVDDDGTNLVGTPWTKNIVKTVLLDPMDAALAALPLPTFPITVPNGGTGLSAYAVGDLLYASAATVLAKLTAVATGQVLTSRGVNTAPAWSASPTLSSLIVAPGTITTSMPISTTQTWNAAGVTFEALVVDITKTAAAAASSLIDIRVGGTSQIKLDTNGNLVFATNLAFGTPSRGYFYLAGDGAFNIANNGNTKNATLTASAANELTFTGGTLKLTALAVGTTPATTGDVRGSSAMTIKARNAANAADVQLLALGASDRVVLGGGGTNNQINIDPGTADVQWVKPLVAVGPTTLITLGKTGGSGPVTAAQNSWLRLLDSTGAACWIPVWK